MSECYVQINDQQYRVMPCLMETEFSKKFTYGSTAIMGPHAEGPFVFFNSGYKLEQLPSTCCMHHYFIFAMMNNLYTRIGAITNYWMSLDTCELCLHDTATQHRVDTKHSMYIRYRAMVIPVILPLMIGRPAPPGPLPYEIMTYHRDGQTIIIPSAMHSAILKVLVAKVNVLNFV